MSCCWFFLTCLTCFHLFHRCKRLQKARVVLDLTARGLYVCFQTEMNGGSRISVSTWSLILAVCFVLWFLSVHVTDPDTAHPADFTELHEFAYFTFVIEHFCSAIISGLLPLVLPMSCQISGCFYKTNSCRNDIITVGILSNIPARLDSQRNTRRNFVCCELTRTGN